MILHRGVGKNDWNHCYTSRVANLSELLDLYGFVCVLSHFRPRGGTLENYFFHIQIYRENKWMIFRYKEKKLFREYHMIWNWQFTYGVKRSTDLIHNDVKQCLCGSNVHCASCGHARIQYGVVFPWSGKFKWQKCWDVFWCGWAVEQRLGAFVWAFRLVKY